MFSGEHELLVNSTVHSPFMIDYIVYETVPDAPVDGDILQMGNNVIQFTEGQDPHLSFSPGWASNSNNAVWTSTPGSYATLKFNGTGVQLYGELAGDSSNVATYRVDDQEPKSFELFPHSSVNVTHQMLFNLSSLTPGEHELVVMHNGTPSGMPSPSTGFCPLPSPPSVPSSHTPSGAIVGGVIGALAILGLLSLLIFVCLKRRRRRLQEERERAHPFTEMPSPTLTKLVTSDFDPYNLDPPHPSLPQRSYKPEFEPLRREESDSLSPVGLLSGQSSEGLRNMKQQQSLTVTQSQSSEQRNSHWNTDETMSPSVLSASALQHSQDSSVVIHTDSGLRMTEPGVFSDRRRVVEVPPNYTAT
ncbi:hypothetical protein VKT23_020158 [Stygiomarasmius scandens]|uniref:Uncharacterized protein n=1 Tax=Marasmiellus scandens TaxID=2682957 RepID=A0ABR1IJP1_9AGAR